MNPSSVVKIVNIDAMLKINTQLIVILDRLNINTTYVLETTYKITWKYNC
jgi:hypothetical protein